MAILIRIDSRGKDALSSAVSKFVPTKTLRRRNHLPWMNRKILQYIKKKLYKNENEKTKTYFKIVSKSTNTPSKVSVKSGINESERICFNNNVDIANCFNEHFVR